MKNAKFLLITSIVSGVLALLTLLYPLILSAYFNVKFDVVSIKNAAAIGIIGGADGPTAILVSKEDGGAAVRYALSALWVIISVVFAILFYKSKKKEKVNE